MPPAFDLDLYLARIGFRGRPARDLSTLRALCRAHVETIPYENLDVQMGTPVTRDPADAFDKIVRRRRGGWCYEMNGLLGAALEGIGFPVRRLAGAVARDKFGDAVIGNHLVLLVDLDETFLADAGFGNGLIEPVPARAGTYVQGPLGISLSSTGGGWMRVAFDDGAAISSYDFNPAVDDEALLEERCLFLQTSADSPFVLNAVVQRWRKDALYAMRGRVLTRIAPAGRGSTLIADAAGYVATLSRVFGLDLPAAATLWPKIAARHKALFGEDALKLSLTNPNQHWV